MFETLLITFREGLEAFLMVAIATLYLRKTGRDALIGGVRAGLALSVAGSIALGIALADGGAKSPLREGSYRSLAAVANNFARESHVDELAALAGIDDAIGLTRQAAAAVGDERRTQTLTRRHLDEALGEPAHWQDQPPDAPAAWTARLGELV